MKYRLALHQGLLLSLSIWVGLGVDLPALANHQNSSQLPPMGSQERTLARFTSNQPGQVRGNAHGIFRVLNRARGTEGNSGLIFTMPGNAMISGTMINQGVQGALQGTQGVGPGNPDNRPAPAISPSVLNDQTVIDPAMLGPDIDVHPDGLVYHDHQEMTADDFKLVWESQQPQQADFKAEALSAPTPEANTPQLSDGEFRFSEHSFFGMAFYQSLTRKRGWNTLAGHSPRGRYLVIEELDTWRVDWQPNTTAMELPENRAEHQAQSFEWGTPETFSTNPTGQPDESQALEQH
jgi:hypothetical protein